MLVWWLWWSQSVLKFKMTKTMMQFWSWNSYWKRFPPISFGFGYIILSQELQVIVFLEKSQVCSTRHDYYLTDERKWSIFHFQIYFLLCAITFQEICSSFSLLLEIFWPLTVFCHPFIFQLATPCFSCLPSVLFFTQNVFEKFQIVLSDCKYNFSCRPCCR